MPADADAARALREYIARQQRLAGVVPDDRTILIETFRDPAGELGLAVLTPFGGKLHQALKLALAGADPPAARAIAGVPARRRRAPVPPAEAGRAAARPLRRA